MKKALTIIRTGIPTGIRTGIPTGILACGLAGGLALSGLAIAAAKEKKPDVPIRNIGEPVSCVSIRQIQSTKVIDDKNIDFKMNGGKILRNTLPYSCPGLNFEDAFTYRLSGSQLCHVDTIRVLERRGGNLEEGAGCGLGKFQRIEKVKPAG